MSRHILERTTLVDAPIEEVAPFFSDPQNLARLTPRSMRFKIVKIDDLPIKPDFRIEYTIRVMGIPVRWVTRIPVYDPPHRFVDVQEKGPYKLWLHEHTFEAIDSQTLMRDRVRYELPFGILGDIVHDLIVKRQLRHIFDHRRKEIRKLFARRAVSA